MRGRPYPISVITGYKNTEEIDKILKLTCFRYIPKAGDFPPEHIKVIPTNLMLGKRDGLQRNMQQLGKKT